MAVPVAPGEDVSVKGNKPVEGSDDQKVMDHIRQCYQEAERAKKSRIAKSFENTQAFLGRQDFTYKQAGQSTEFLPMVAMAVEQIASFLKKAIADYGDWFTMEIAKNPFMDENQGRELLLTQLNTLSRVQQENLDFPTLISDAAKVGLNQALVIFKVHGRHFKQLKYTVERGEKMKDVKLPSGRTVTVPH